MSTRRDDDELYRAAARWVVVCLSIGAINAIVTLAFIAWLIR